MKVLSSYRPVVLIVVTIFVSLLLQSCSSIISGTTQKITITSNVNGADVSINGNPVGTTPLTTRIKREKTMHLIVKKEGYENYQSVMQTRLDNWFWGNIIFGGLLGSTTDLASGTTHLLDPDHIHVQLVENQGKTSQANDKMHEDVEFSLITYKELMKEIKAGQGSYLSSLYELKNITTEKEQGEFLSFLRNQILMENDPDPLQFAQSIGQF